MFDAEDIKPTCIRIVEATDQDKSLTSYNAETYEGVNDSDTVDHLTKPHTATTRINIASISKCINLHQQADPTKQSYSLTELSNNIDDITILKMRMNLEQKQMDSGANKNVTDDCSIIRNYTQVKQMAVYGIKKDEVACQIIGKGITKLSTFDGSTFPIVMYYAPECAGTIISPNAIVKDSKNFTGW